MLDLNYVRNNLEAVRKRLASRGPGYDLSEFARLDGQRRTFLQDIEVLRRERNVASQAIAQAKKEGRDTSSQQEEVRLKGSEIKGLEDKLAAVEESLKTLLTTIPNLPHPSVPVGSDETANSLVRIWGDKPRFSFEPRDHVDLGTQLGILDPGRAGKITGARFSVYVGAGAKLERALINFMLDVHTSEHGYREVLPPFAVNSQSLFGTGNLPKFEGDLFKLAGTDYFLIPTAEVPVTNFFRSEIIDGEDLPIALVAYTPCFRSEAGSYGKDTRGLIRQHQFNKVELVRFSKPDCSYDELEKLTRHAEEILRRLRLHYRVVTLCTGDMGFASAKTYDLEVWLPSQNRFREISSCSNFEDFQARRASIRFRNTAKDKPHFAHTLNGSGLAIGRTWVAIVENYQQEDGTIAVPDALQPYMNGMTVIQPERWFPSQV
jgi:seryl-tRNA synthetase